MSCYKLTAVVLFFKVIACLLLSKQQIVSSHFIVVTCRDYTSQVVTYKNHALDNFLKDCLNKVSSPEVKIVRVGSLPEDADEDLKKCLLTKVCSESVE